MASTSDSDSSTTSLSLWPSNVRGRWMPGVSTKTNWAWSVVRMPRMAFRVVSGRDDAMAICDPISALINVDLPTFGRPTTATNPERYGMGAAESACSAVVTMLSSVMLVFGILVVVRCLAGIVGMIFVPRSSFVHAIDVGGLHHNRRDLLATARGIDRSKPQATCDRR